MSNEKKEDEKKTILIFGVSSFLGSNLAQILRKDFKVIGTYHKDPVSLPGILTIPCDVLAKDEVQLIIYAFKPDITVYAEGVSSVYEAHKKPEIAEAYNTSGLFNVAEYCHRYRSQVCYVSSSYVFGGEDKQYIEMDIPDSNTVIGKTQSQAEFYIQKTSLNYIIFRACNLYGRSILPNMDPWFEKIQRNILTGERINADNYVKVGFLDVFYLGTLMKICFEKKVANRLFQVCSKDTLTHYEFAEAYTKVFNENSKLIEKGKWTFPVEENRRGDSNKYNFHLDVSNIESFLNVNMPTVEESLEFTFRRMHGKQSNKRKTKKGAGISFI
ncbi:MAG: sugar nucleotide-binding protein [Bacteriovoracaceae bacterium]|nr:sugar nucleotide-binding protein [Bacteriovoracaceae bacterium]